MNRLFIGTDRRDWKAVERCFAPKVRFDMTSVAGGSPAELTPREIAGAWETGLAPLEQIHHQAGNFLIEVNGDEAKAFCYGIALHYKKTASGQNTRTFVGSYDFVLRRNVEDDGRAPRPTSIPTSPWLIEAFRFNLKFIDGNLELEKG